MSNQNQQPPFGHPGHPPQSQQGYVRGTPHTPAHPVHSSAEQQAHLQQQAYSQQQGYAQQGYAQQQGYPQQQQGYAQQGYPQQQQGYAQQQNSMGQPPQPPRMQPPPQRGQRGRGIAAADATAGAPPRVRFLRLTYLHLTIAIFAFAGLSRLLMNNETIIKTISNPILKFSLGGRWNWGVFLGLFIAVGYVADHWARKRGSRSLQYMGLGLYVIAEAVIFLPLLFIAELKGAEIMAKGGGDPQFIRDAAYITIGLFSALTASVFLTKKDFSFLRSGLSMFSVGALILIYLSLAGGFNLGIVFSFAMVILAGGYVLYYTSQVLAHYDSESYVAASLALFSAVALMFWYVIRILMKLRE